MKFLIPVMVGGVIGYITNWLAIKMLFRPYEEKYIFKIKVPFTPGLIPKEQKRIARSVGETIGEYLLSDEVIAKNIERIDLEGKIEEGLLKKLVELEKRELSLGQGLELLNISRASLGEGLQASIKNPLVRDIQEGSIKEQMFALIDKSIDRIDLDTELDSLKPFMMKKLKDFKSSDSLKKILDTEFENVKKSLKVNEKELGQVLNPELVEKVIDGNIDYVQDILKDLVDDFNVYSRVKKMLIRTVDENLSKALRIFISSEDVAEKIYKIIEKRVYSDDFVVDIKLLLLAGYEKFKTRQVGEIVEQFDGESLDRLIGKLGRDSLARVLEDSRLEDFIDNLLLAVSKEDINIKSSLKYRVKNIYLDYINSPEFMDSVDRFWDKNVSKLLDLDLAYIISTIDEEKKVSFARTLSETLVGKFKNRLKDIVAMLNIPKIIEEEINGFEMNFAEKLILDIASKELRAITWLGALLGGLLGILTPLIQRI